MKRRKTTPGRPTNRPTPIQCARVRKASRHDIEARAQHGRSAGKGDDGSTVARSFDWRGQSRRSVPMQCKNPRTADSHAFNPNAWRRTPFNVFEAVQCVLTDRKARAISTNFDKTCPTRRYVRPHCGAARPPACFNLSLCRGRLERAGQRKTALNGRCRVKHAPANATLPGPEDPAVSRNAMFGLSFAHQVGLSAKS